MRRLLFVLLIMLLPLRGWVGDAMATQMALAGSHALVAGAMQHADSASAPAHAHVRTIASAASDDCSGLADARHTGDDTDAAHCEACAMCQTCHTVAILQPPALLAATQSSPTSPSAIRQVFASADRALLLKPPIS